ncbi:unnamed protein product [Schistosoma mattheei]|nr:unnamed protein product [Schistosoma mattheei]
MILRPDKGSGVVLMNTADYVTKMKQILDDQLRFKVDKSQKDLTDSTEKRIKGMLRELLKRKMIGNSTYNDLKPRGSRLPHMYGLPKVHKHDVPLRPILSMINSPYHKVARWLAEKLEPVRRRLATYTLKDSFQFADRLNRTNVADKFMVSFDVTSLFTNIPLLETIDIICQNYDLLPLPAPEFKKLLLMCTTDVQFQFNNTIYRQIDGVAMGSPLGPILADIFMGYLENMVLKQTISETTEYSRYVDDTFIVCNNKQHAIHMLKHFNNAHPNIQFTMEHEQNDMFHFLDVAIKRRRDGTVQRSIYRKSTWNGIYLNFNSFCPLSYKKALVKTLFYRAEKICTTDKLEEELMKVEKCLRDNFYPQKFIDKYKKRKQNNTEVITVNKKPITISLNFKGDEVTNTINRRLNTALARTYPAAKLQILYKTTCSITQSKVDKHPFHVTANCIYKFTCTCQSSYIGRTERRAYLRFFEHVPKSLRTRERKTLNSAITKHLLDTGHQVDTLQSFKVISKQPNSSLLKFAEAVAIRRQKPDLCVQKEMVINLSLPW